MKKLNENMYSLVGVDGNAYAVMGYVTKAMKECGKSKEELDAYRQDAMSSDYNHLICVSADMVDLLNNETGYTEEIEDEPMFDDEYDEYELDFDDENDRMFESLEYPAYEDVNLDEEVNVPAIEFEDDMMESQYLETINSNSESLYMSDEDLASVNLTVEDIKNAAHGLFLDVIIANGKDVQIIIKSSDLYKFYNKFAKSLKENTGVSVVELKPFIYNADEMNAIVREYFKAHRAK